MSLILSIDTSTEQASICVAENGHSLCFLSNSTQKDHASWLHPAIQEAFETAGRSITALGAVAVTAGPGSYTGLRVGMASAKGLCYALNLPLITLNTLDAMASAAANEGTDYICPMIDARRMEVFTALYDNKISTIIAPCAMILEEGHFGEYLEKGKVLFFGSGAEKWQRLQQHPNAVFKQISFNAENMGILAYKKLLEQDFSSLAYAEPIYIKDWQ